MICLNANSFPFLLQRDPSILLTLQTINNQFAFPGSDAAVGSGHKKFVTVFTESSFEFFRDSGFYFHGDFSG